MPPGFEQDRSAELYEQVDPSKPKNVILLIGDGMDDSMITAARNYELGADGRFALDELPLTGAMTTHGLKVGTGPDYPIAYVSDSAPTATGWSTGKKTVDGRVSQGPSTADNIPGEDYETVLEREPSTLPTPPESAPDLALAVLRSVNGEKLEESGLPVSVSATSATAITVSLIARGTWSTRKSSTGREETLVCACRSARALPRE